MDRTSMQKSLATVFALFFLILPIWKFLHSINKNDPVIHTAGKWLANNSAFLDVKMFTNDMRLLFYSHRKLKGIGRGVFLGSEKGDMIHQVVQHDYIDMEKTAIINKRNQITKR